MSGDLFDDIMNQEIKALCEDREMDFGKFFRSIKSPPTMANINDALAETFPGELKLIK